MGKQFTGKAGIVTGASSGIGRAIARRLGAAGMELWLVGRSKEQLEATAAEITAAGNPAVHCAPLDLAESGALAALVAEVGSRHPWLAALVNNAGVMYPEPVTGPEAPRWQAMFAVNLFSPMEGCRAAVEQMRRHGKPGHLINVSSMASEMPFFGAYGVSKIALEHLGETLRHELERDDIRITTITPGGFATNLSRDFSPAEMARLQAASARLGLELTGPDAERAMADPDHVAGLVEYLLCQPAGISLDRVTIRPPLTLPLE